MSKTVISVEHLSKKYDLGVIGAGTVRKDLSKWWARLRGKPDPYSTIGMTDHNNRKNESILALNDVSFEVKQGEVLGIIGGNGAGKSTLLKILSQVTAPTSGEVKIRGRIGSLLEVGTGFHPQLTGRENIYLNGSILGMTRAEVNRKFDEIVDFSGVEKFIDTPVKRYSSGMYVRLAFAVAAHLEPEILIVDEVLAVGDLEFQKKCLGKMGNFAGDGRTVLFVSHNMGAVIDLCPHSILLDNGEIKQRGNSLDVINKYTKSMSLNKLTPERNLEEVHKGRIHKGPAKLVDISMRNLSEELCTKFSFDDPISFDIGFQGFKNTSYILDLEIKNQQGQCICHINNFDDNYFISKTSEKQTSIRIKIKNNILHDGKYFVNVKLIDTLGQLNDQIENVLAFEIITIGRKPFRSQGLVVQSGEWSQKISN